MKRNIISTNLSKTQLLVYNALFIAISVILKILFEVYVPLGGLPTLRLNLTAIPIILSGIILDPISGFLVGVISDLLCFVIKPFGPLFIGFTLSSGLTGFIPGILWWYVGNIRGVKWFNLLLSLGGIAYLFGSGSVSFQAGEFTFMGDPVSIWIVILLATLIILFSVFPFISQYYFRKSNLKLDDKLLFVITIEQIVNSIILNTIWLSLLYGQAWRVLLPARIITNIFLIPFYTVVIALVLKVVKIPRVKVKSGGLR